MNFLVRERAAVNKYVPGLDDRLQQFKLQETESPGNPSIAVFKELGGPGLLIPEKYGGGGATAVDACRVQHAIATRSPSLAIATTMHQFSVATLVQMATVGAGLEWLALEAVARQKLMMASGFAEGRKDAGILSPVMSLTRTPDGFTVSGSKKPCSLSASMDLLTLSVLVPGEKAGEDRLAVVLLPGSDPQIERKPFWKSPILAGAESDEVILHEVPVPEKVISYSGAPGALDNVQIGGFLWFELLITSSYLGMASGLVERVVTQKKGAASERTRLGTVIEGAIAALEGLAHEIDRGDRSPHLLARSLFVRYAVQQAIEGASMLAAELLGGMAFIGAIDVAYFFASSRALAFHPPSRDSMAEYLAEYLSGDSLNIR